MIRSFNICRLKKEEQEEREREREWKKLFFDLRE
jgi:hypothetical protein